MNSKTSFLLLIFFSILLAACTSNSSTTALNAEPAAGNPLLNEINHVDEIKEIFNQDSGKVRLVLLLAPT